MFESPDEDDDGRWSGRYCICPELTRKVWQEEAREREEREKEDSSVALGILISIPLMFIIAVIGSFALHYLFTTYLPGYN
jgi:hypothetical protein